MPLSSRASRALAIGCVTLQGAVPYLLQPVWQVRLATTVLAVAILVLMQGEMRRLDARGPFSDQGRTIDRRD